MAESVTPDAAPEVAAPVVSTAEPSTPLVSLPSSPCPDRAAAALTPEPALSSSPSSVPTLTAPPATPRRPIALGDRLQCVWAEDGLLRLRLSSLLFLTFFSATPSHHPHTSVCAQTLLSRSAHAPAPRGPASTGTSTGPSVCAPTPCVFTLIASSPFRRPQSTSVWTAGSTRRSSSASATSAAGATAALRPHSHQHHHQHRPQPSLLRPQPPAPHFHPQMHQQPQVQQQRVPQAHRRTGARRRGTAGGGTRWWRRARRRLRAAGAGSRSWSGSTTRSRR